jgi:glucose-fructose oxidoreductase
MHRNLPFSSQSRRRFMQKLSLSVGAALTVPGLSPVPGYGSPRYPTLPDDKKLGVALVGLGYYSTDLLAPALQETKLCRLAGIVTGTPEKAEKWKKQYNIPAKNVYNYQTFDRIADNKDIDIVYVVLPNSMHAEYVIRAAKAGKHVICEKPMALNVRECEQMIDACKNAGRKLSIGYRMHYEPTTQEIMRIGKEKTLGELRFVTAGAGYRESRADHWKVKKAYGGGAMMDMGVYSLQAALYAVGEEPVSVSAQHFTNRPDIFKEVDEITSFQLEFPGGTVANLHTSFGANMNYLQVTAADGWYRLDPFSAYSGIRGESNKGPLNFPVINQQAAQMDDFADCIRNNKPTRTPGEMGLRDIRIVEAIYRSAANGQKINLGKPAAAKG